MTNTFREPEPIGARKPAPRRLDRFAGMTTYQLISRETVPRNVVNRHAPENTSRRRRRTWVLATASASASAVGPRSRATRRSRRLTQVRDRIRPSADVQTQARRRPAEAKTHRCPATSTRLRFVDQSHPPPPTPTTSSGSPATNPSTTAAASTATGHITTDEVQSHNRSLQTEPDNIDTRQPLAFSGTRHRGRIPQGGAGHSSDSSKRQPRDRADPIGPARSRSAAPSR